MKANDGPTEHAMDFYFFIGSTYTYLWVGREIFWGDDRLEDALDWAESPP